MPPSTTTPAPSARGPDAYDHFETVRNSDGLIAIITRRKLNGAFSVAIYREFERNGQTEKTSFISRRHIDSAIELLKISGEKIDKASDEERAASRVAK